MKFSLHSPVTPSLLGPNILLSSLFLNTVSLRSSLNASDQVSHPYKTTDKTTVLYTSMFKFLNSKLEDKRSCSEWQQAFPDFNLLLLSSWIEFWFIKVFPKYLISSTLSKEWLSIFMLWLRPAFWFLHFFKHSSKTQENIMCRADGEEETSIQGLGGETWGKDTTWMTETWMGELY